MEKKYYYKAMSKDMKCRGFQFKVGETYTIDSKKLELCSDKVFHFCKKLEDTIDYYDSPTDRHFLIEVLEDIVIEENKSGSNKIRIVREISKTEIEEHIQDKEIVNSKEFLALYTTDVKTLEILSKDKDWRVRQYVAQNLTTPVYIIENLAKDKHWRVRSAVAENSNTPVYLLEELAKDKSGNVLYEVAENVNIPTHLLEILAKNEYEFVRRNVAKNPNTPIHILAKLSKDKIDIIREQAQKRLKEITQ